MLSRVFDYDNPVWRFIGKFLDIFILNILWLICSIPIVTMGASTTAVYYVTLRLVRDEEDSTTKSFFKSFKENFKQATIIWLLLLAAGILLAFDLYIFIMAPATEATAFRTVMLALLGGITFVWAAILLYVFPLLSRFVNPVKKTLFNAFFLSVRHLLQTIGILAIDAGILVVAWMTLPVLPVLMLVLGLFGFPFFAFINSYFFTGIFMRYMPKQEETDEHVD